jgi:hypothetical protein
MWKGLEGFGKIGGWVDHIFGEVQREDLVQNEVYRKAVRQKGMERIGRGNSSELEKDKRVVLLDPWTVRILRENLRVSSKISLLLYCI